MFASRRVVLVGDSQQLAPISRISRVLPTSQMKWLAMSGLSHLDTIATKRDGVHVLRVQRRMHDEIGQIVSRYKYDSHLITAPEVSQREYKLPEPLAEDCRAIWYVLDEEPSDLPSIRAERGPGNRSWIRKSHSVYSITFFPTWLFKIAMACFFPHLKLRLVWSIVTSLIIIFKTGAPQRFTANKGPKRILSSLIPLTRVAIVGRMTNGNE